MKQTNVLIPALVTALCLLCLPEVGVAQKGGKVTSKIYWLFKKFDTNRDKALEKSEVPAKLWDKLLLADLNKDGKVTIKELFIAKKKGKGGAKRKGKGGK